MIFQILIIVLLNLVTTVMYAGRSTVIVSPVNEHPAARAARLGHQAPVAQPAQVHQMVMPQPAPAQQPVQAPQQAPVLQPVQAQQQPNPVAAAANRRLANILAQLMPRARL
jgi:hypothetical protein